MIPQIEFKSSQNLAVNTEGDSFVLLLEKISSEKARFNLPIIEHHLTNHQFDSVLPELDMMIQEREEGKQDKKLVSAVLDDDYYSDDFNVEVDDKDCSLI